MTVSCKGETIKPTRWRPMKTGGQGLASILEGPPVCPGKAAYQPPFRDLLTGFWRLDNRLVLLEDRPPRAIGALRKGPATMEQPPPITEPPPAAAPQEPTMSLIARLMNVFAVPGDVFDEVKLAASKVSNWLVPVLIGSVVGAISIVIVFSQPDIKQQMREKQSAAMAKKFDELVQANKMTREQADRQLEQLEKFMGPAMMMISGSMTMVFWSFARIFFWALVLWLVGRWLLKARFDYMKTAEIVGLATMIGVLGMIVKTLLQVNFSNPSASPSPALMVGEFDEKNLLHMMLAMLNLFDLWEVGVMGVGLARLAATSWMRATVPVVVIWLLVSAALGTVSALAVRLGS